MEGWKSLSARFTTAGVKPETWILDNECSNKLKNSITGADITSQLVPSYSHQANATERTIQTFKSYLKTGLSLVDADFSITEWD